MESPPQHPFQAQGPSHPIRQGWDGGFSPEIAPMWLSRLRVPGALLPMGGDDPAPPGRSPGQTGWQRWRPPRGGAAKAISTLTAPTAASRGCGPGVPGGVGSVCRLRAGEAPSGEKKPRAGAGAAEAGSDHPSLSRAVVEVTGHAHVLLAAFEKVSPVPPLTARLTFHLLSCPAHSRRPVNAGGVAAGLLSAWHGPRCEAHAFLGAPSWVAPCGKRPFAWKDSLISVTRV